MLTDSQSQETLFRMASPSSPSRLALHWATLGIIQLSLPCLSVYGGCGAMEFLNVYVVRSINQRLVFSTGGRKGAWRFKTSHSPLLDSCLLEVKTLIYNISV